MSLCKHTGRLNFANDPQRTTFREANRLEALALHEFPNPNVQAPSLLSLVGGCRKSVIMRKLSLSWSASSTVGEEPAPAFLAQSLLSRLLMPFSDVLCFFTAYYRGLQGVAETMQALMDKGQGSNLSSLIAPKTFVILENDEMLAYADLIASQYLVHKLQTNRMGNITVHFSEIRVISIPSGHHEAMMEIPFYPIDSAISVIASGILLDSKPPGMYRFDPVEIFHTFYCDHCHDAASNFSAAISPHAFTDLLPHCFCEYAENLRCGNKPAKLYYLEMLRKHGYLFNGLHSESTCFACFSHKPKRLLPCGHTLCKDCVVTFGDAGLEQPYTFRLKTCILCGSTTTSFHIQIKPPTAGIRLLCVDGRSVRGVLPLKALQQIKNHVAELAGFHLRIQDFFDMVYDTSSKGGLIAFGLFIKGWSVEECLKRFINLAENAFKPRKFVPVPVLSKIQELLISYLADSRYKAQSLENALQEAWYSFGSMRCTSAAPWFFSPMSLPGVGTFQGGGLCYNNPFNITLWELLKIWTETQDDLKAMYLLNNASVNHVECATKIRIAESLIAKTFYFELDGLPAYMKGQDECLGYISCRLQMIHQKMLRKKITSQTVPEDHLLYSLPIIFSVRDLSQELTINICSSCTGKSAISMFPSLMMRIIQAQSLGAVFNPMTTLKWKTTDDICGGPKAKCSRPPYYQI
ncbi:hypothetical protein C7212DRAFT_348296 [Tuber magnatum]|uniref:RING-type domain-containing protein n=1 Tax=Tuber magnatum TaxID=42249 RepID=A0A317SD07_9PEZI|nr:hypothetical protein C7212DRAFT_348296 [Tuber magnatum]